MNDEIYKALLSFFGRFNEQEWKHLFVNFDYAYLKNVRYVLKKVMLEKEYSEERHLPSWNCKCSECGKKVC